MAEITFSQREIEWLTGGRGKGARTETAWRLAFPQTDLWQWRWRGIRTPEMLQKTGEVEQEAERLKARIEDEAKNRAVQAAVIMRPSGEVLVTQSATLLVAWSSFEPGNIGIVDFHGSQRNYSREDLTQITLNEDDEETRWRGGSLWNYENKYTNIKNAMAGEYIRELIRRESGMDVGEPRRLIPEMSRLMQRFLKGKQFGGPRIRGKGEIYFPVETRDGAEHDIDDLSSGEKEVVFGYLRAQTNTPRDSIIMIDEPELHLNPALMKGLARFYQEGMVKNQENQLWLVSHSDAFLRDAVETEGVHVYHMQAARGEQGNQITRVDKENEVQRLLIEIVGDMATFKPRGCVIMLEGDRDDQWIVESLFPEIEDQATVVGGGGQRQVLAIRRVLERIEQVEGEKREVFAITDGDWSTHEEPTGGSAVRSGYEKQWDRFHVENYLLEGKFICAAMRRLSKKDAGKLPTSHEIEKAMQVAACSLVEPFANEIVEREVRESARRASRIPGGRGAQNLAGVCKAKQLHEATLRVADRIEQLRETEWTEEEFRKRMAEEERRLSESLTNGRWKETFRGRDILRKLVEAIGDKYSYEVLKIEIVRQMQEVGFRPTGMAAVLESVGMVVRREG